MQVRVKKPYHLFIITTSLFLVMGVCAAFAQPQALPSDYKMLPILNWQFNTGKPLYASPVVSDNVVFIGGLDSVLYALDIHSGKTIWRFKTNGEIRSAVCFDDDKLYLNGGDGTIYALGKNSGNLLWRFNTQGERKYDFADYFHSSPVFHQGLLYVGSGDGGVYALSTDKGQLVWKFQTGNIVHATPAISHGRLFVGSFDGFVYALNSTTGELIWKFKTVGHRYFPAGEVQGSPAVLGNLVFIGARDYNVYALDQEKGFCHWNKAFTKGWGLSNTIHDSILYIGSADERVLISVDPPSGREFWKQEMEFLVFGNMVFSEAMLYMGTTIGKLHGIALHSGEKLWSYTTESYLSSRQKYFKSDDSYRDDIYSIILSNEQFLEVECELGGIFSTPCITNELILFSSTNGIVYCLRR